MVISGYKEEFISYVLKSDGDRSYRKISMPSSTNEHHYLLGSISSLIQGKVYIFGGLYRDYSSRVSHREYYNFNLTKIAMVNDCEIKELHVKLDNWYTWNSAAVTAADQQSGKDVF